MRTRQIQIKIYVNEYEKAELDSLCEKTKLSYSKLFRYLVLGYYPPEGPPVNYDELIFQLRALGNNINQILHIARTNGILNQKDLQNHLDDLRKIEKKMDAAVEIERR